MGGEDLLKSKKVLVVDDEEDVLAYLAEHLDACNIEKASTYESAKKLLETRDYDAAILDIMGVDGFKLLEIATKKGIPALMLTAHGLSPDALMGSIKGGARSYIPKDKITEIEIYLKEIFVAQQKGVEKSGKWFARLGSFFDDRFGSGWKEKDKDFWQDFDKEYRVSKEELEGML